MFCIRGALDCESTCWFLCLFCLVTVDMLNVCFVCLHLFLFFADFVCVCFEARKMQLRGRGNYENFHSEKGAILSEQFMLPTLSTATAHELSHSQSHCWCPREVFRKDCWLKC